MHSYKSGSCISHATGATPLASPQDARTFALAQSGLRATRRPPPPPPLKPVSAARRRAADRPDLAWVDAGCPESKKAPLEAGSPCAQGTLGGQPKALPGRAGEQGGGRRVDDGQLA